MLPFSGSVWGVLEQRPGWKWHLGSWCQRENSQNGRCYTWHHMATCFLDMVSILCVKFLLLCRWLWISKMSISWAPQINDVTMELLAGDIRVIGSHLGSTSFCKGLLSHSNDFCWCQVRIYIVFINLYMIHGFMHFSLIHVFLHRIRHNF